MNGAQLKVERVHRAWMDRARAYKVLVDGSEVGEVRDGQTEVFELAPGPHQVQMKIDWALSEPLGVELPAGGQVHLRCQPNAHPLTALWYISVARGRYIGLERVA